LLTHVCGAPGETTMSSFRPPAEHHPAGLPGGGPRRDHLARRIVSHVTVRFDGAVEAVGAAPDRIEV
jgi:hypothetical protein